jgi:hypothetical protein
MNATLEVVPSVLERTCKTLVGLKTPRALEVLDQTVRQLARGECSALEAIDTLFACSSNWSTLVTSSAP